MKAVGHALKVEPGLNRPVLRLEAWITEAAAYISWMEVTGLI
jgi:hypothetical protein